MYSDEDYDDTSSVIRLQLGLLGNARELQTDLDRIADSADTSTNSGLHYILEETCLSLMRNPQFWAYANVDSKVLRTIDVICAFFLKVHTCLQRERDSHP